MPVNASVLSGNARFTFNGKTIFHSTGCSLDTTIETKERATKDIKGTDVSIGKLAQTGSVDALATYGANGETLDSFDLYDIVKNQAKEGTDFEFVPFDSDADKKLVGKVVFTSHSLKLDNDEDGTQSINFSVKGALDVDTVKGGEFESPKLDDEDDGQE